MSEPAKFAEVLCGAVLFNRPAYSFLPVSLIFESPQPRLVSKKSSKNVLYPIYCHKPSKEVGFPVSSYIWRWHL